MDQMRARMSRVPLLFQTAFFVLWMTLLFAIASANADGVKISERQRNGRPDISDGLVVYYGYDEIGYNALGPILANQGIYVYNKKVRQTYKIAVPAVQQESPLPRIGGDFIVWSDYANGWDVFGCRFDRATGQCPVHRLTSDPANQFGADVSTEGLVVWEDERNNLLNTTYGNKDIYGCDYNPVTGACPERQITSNLSNQTNPKVSGRRIAWADVRNVYQQVFTCVDDPQSGACPEVQVTKNAGNWYPPYAVSDDRILAVLYATTTGDPNAWSNGLYLFDMTLSEDRPRDLTGIVEGADLDGSFAVWSYYGTNFDVWGRHLTTNQTTQLTTDPKNDTAASVSKGCVAYLGSGTGTGQVYLSETLCPPHPPVLAPIVDKTAPEGAAMSVALVATDEDGDKITYALSPLPSGATFEAATGVFRWTPTFVQAGTYGLTATATDETNRSDSKSFTITVTNTNQQPVLAPIANQTVAENVLLSFTVTATDPDGDPVTYSASSAGPLPNGALLDPKTGAFSWTPEFGQAGIYLIPFTASDGTLEDMESVTITVTEGDVNESPTLLPIGPKAGMEGEELRFTAVAQDPDGDALTFGATGLPAGARVDATTGVFTWIPTYEQAGSYPVTITVVDIGGLGDLEDIVLTIEEGNRPPEFDPIADQACKEGERLQFTVSATDHDGDPVTYAASPLLPGAAFDAFSRTFSWTTGYDQEGNHEVVFTASDPYGASQAQPVLFTVTNVNRTPGFTNLGNQTITVGQTLKFQLTASDPDGDPLSFSAAGLPKGATFDQATATFTWKPASNQAGQYVVTFMVSDGTAATSKAITITVVKSTARTSGRK